MHKSITRHIQQPFLKLVMMKFLNIDRNIVHIYFFLKNEILGNIDYYRIDQNKVYKICMKLLSD